MTLNFASASSLYAIHISNYIREKPELKDNILAFLRFFQKERKYYEITTIQLFTLGSINQNDMIQVC